MLSQTKAQKDGVAYFFCNHDEKNRRENLPILQSLVRQLAAPKSNTSFIRRSLQEARDRAVKRGSRLGPSDCLNQLVESTNLYSTTVIVLDALDEVDTEELGDLIQSLEDIMSRTQDGKIKVFISSRPKEEIGLTYDSKSTVIIQATDNRSDIEKFIDEEMGRHEKTKPQSVVNTKRDEIKERLLQKWTTYMFAASDKA